jgi:uncharacterized protein (DUF2252 family)
MSVLDSEAASASRVEPGERAARGRAARERAPRSSHGDWSPAKDRPDPIGLLEEQAADRVPELVPIRYGRMLSSPFAFYRGAALLMASDLSGTPTSGIEVQACGDAHLSNFGVFASPERTLVFDVNDFDETLPGPWEWDLKRLAASLEIAAQGRGFSDAERAAIVTASARSYREAMRAFARMPTMRIWYSRADASLIKGWRGVRTRDTKRIATAAAKAETKDSLRALSKLITRRNGQLGFISQPPLIVPVDTIVRESDGVGIGVRLRELIHVYARSLPPDRQRLIANFHAVDMAKKAVGVGSVGTRCWVTLLIGRDDEDPLFLQAKEAGQSVLERFVGKSEYATHGQRVVEGQRLMQASSDVLLGWVRTEGIDGVERDFYVRQLWDWKGSAEVEVLAPRQMCLYGEVCAWTLARAHARSGDPIAIAAYLGKTDVFDRAIARFAGAYAEQSERDFEALGAAEGSGRVRAERDV